MAEKNRNKNRKNQGDEWFKTVMEAYNITRRYLVSHARTKGWDRQVVLDAGELLRLYCVGSHDRNQTGQDIRYLEAKLGRMVVREVRKRFSTLCYLNPEVANTPGQAQSWFPSLMQSTEEFHASKPTGNGQRP